MCSLQLPDSFQRSCENFESYPNNLVYRTSYLGALQAYATRLDTTASRLFTNKEDDILVPFRDYASTGQVFEKKKILDDQALKTWLGDQSNTSSVIPACVGPAAAKKDPKCRFIFILADHSRKPLKITRKMLLRILSYNQVMPSYLDFISVFGSQSEPRDLRFSGFREQTLLSIPARGLVIPSLGRSGRQFQLSYNLKAVACLSNSNADVKQKEWSIRQAAFHHQFDVVDGTTLWIVTRGGHDIKDRVQGLTGKDGRIEDRTFQTTEECFRSSLAVHLLYGQWSMEEWRWYIQWLEDIVDHETHIAVHGSREWSHGRQEYLPKHVQQAQNHEDKTNEAIMILEANADILASLCNYYAVLGKNKDFPLKDACAEDILAFTVQLNDMIQDSKMQATRAKLLARIIADRKSLILQHLQSQATEKMEKLTVSMYDVGTSAQKETIAMRIITVVTLIYLPATFVSTFFSTDIIKYQNGDDLSGTWSNTAFCRWLQVTLPLSALTLGFGYIWFKRADKKRQRQQELLPRYSPKPHLNQKQDYSV